MRVDRERRPTVVLLSGGLDSAANLALASERDEVILAVTADYGQRAAQSEIRAARDLSAHFGVAHRLIQLPFMSEVGRSALTGKQWEIPDLQSCDLDELSVTRQTASQVWVPNRNALLISAAGALAESLHATQLAVGFNREEAETFPDNTTEFLEAMTHAFRFSTSNHLRVMSYTDHMNKKEIVERLRELKSPFPFEKLWSCYREGPQPCLRCESCQRLQRALS